MAILNAFKFTIIIIVIFLLFVASAYFLYIAVIIGAISLLFFTILKIQRWTSK